jgi:DNA mismatch repair protein MutS
MKWARHLDLRRPGAGLGHRAPPAGEEPQQCPLFHALLRTHALAQDYREAANIHLDAVEHKDSIVFLHAVEEGPASRSYGLQVAALAGVPKPVIRNAGKYLQMLEEAALNQGGQHDLFAQAATSAASVEPVTDALREAMAQLNPDELSPREALDLLYRLKKL